MMNIKRFPKRIAGLFLSFACLGMASASDEEIRFGVFPQLSIRVMAETYQPLAEYLSNATNQTVGLGSATDFLTFNKRTMDGEYDLVLTAPHLAWLAWKEGGYRPILTYTEAAKGFLIVRADSPYQKISDLKGKVIAMPDPIAVVNIRMEKILENAGLRPGQDLKITETGSHTNAATHVYQGQADAAVVGVLAFLRLPKEVRDGMRTIAETPAMTSHVYLVHPNTSRPSEKAIKRAIEEFTSTEAGQAFLKKGGFGGIRSLKRNELQQMEVDAKELKRRLQAQTSSESQKK